MLFPYTPADRPAETCFICKTDYLPCVSPQISKILSKADKQGSNDTSACFWWRELNKESREMLEEQAHRFPDFIYMRTFIDQYRATLLGAYYCEDFFPRTNAHFDIKGVTTAW